jgi:nitroreductase
LDREILNRILEAGRKAPSAKNRQPWRFIIIEKEELKKKIENAAFGQEHVSQSSVIIAGCSTNIDYRMPNGQLSHPVDISFSMSFMMLQAVREGLGTCIVTTFDEQEVKELLSVPYSMKVIMLLLIGYPSEKPLPELRKPIERIIAFNHW